MHIGSMCFIPGLEHVRMLKFSSQCSFYLHNTILIIVTLRILKYGFVISSSEHADKLIRLSLSNIIINEYCHAKMTL